MEPERSYATQPLVVMVTMPVYMTFSKLGSRRLRFFKGVKNTPCGVLKIESMGIVI